MDWLTYELFWFLLGVILFIMEFFLPGVLLVFFGIGAWIAAFTTWLGITPGLGTQNLVFIISSVILLLTLRKKMTRVFVGDSNADTVADEFIGKQVRVIADTGTLEGKAELKGSEWQARSATPIAAGSFAIVEKREGLTLFLTPIS